MKRREFIAGLGGAAAWPLAVRAQESGRVRRIGVLIPENNPGAKARIPAFTQTLEDIGWTDGCKATYPRCLHGEKSQGVTGHLLGDARPARFRGCGGEPIATTHCKVISVVY
jgi:hypothetical protein